MALPIQMQEAEATITPEGGDVEKIELAVTMTRPEAESVVQALLEAGLEEPAMLFKQALDASQADEGAMALQQEIIQEQPRER
jgi:hypothetical protein